MTELTDVHFQYNQLTGKSSHHHCFYTVLASHPATILRLLLFLATAP